jgi:hypothetical protein
MRARVLAVMTETADSSSGPHVAGATYLTTS